MLSVPPGETPLVECSRVADGMFTQHGDGGMSARFTIAQGEANTNYNGMNTISELCKVSRN